MRFQTRSHQRSLVVDKRTLTRRLSSFTFENSKYILKTPLAKKQSKFLRGRRIDPKPITGKTNLVDLVDNAFLAYNAARLREACWLFSQKMLEPDVTVGVTLTGALTPAGLGMSALIPLIQAGFIDWIISTGANFYHDTHFGIGLKMHEGNAQTSDIVLRDEEVV